MDDLERQNFASVAGSVSLVTSPFGSGGSALSFGTSGSWTVPDSLSSSLAAGDGVVGGAALEGWFRVPSFPAGTATILGKAASYELKITPGQRLQWVLTNGGATATVVSVGTIASGTWYHVAGVYNGDYTGVTQFGGTTAGAVVSGIPGDYFHGSPVVVNNMQICKCTAPEKGVLNGVVMDLQMVGDASLAQYVRAVVYEDLGGVPGALLAESVDQRLGTGVKGVAGGARGERAWITFPLTCSLFPGSYWLGFMGGESNGICGIGYFTSGGIRDYKYDDHGYDANDASPTSGAPDPFGALAGADAAKLSAYGTYTATGRTGAEGQALLYINGRQDATVPYAHGIADTANNLQHPTGLAVDLADWAIYNKKLTAIQVATHYGAR